MLILYVCYGNDYEYHFTATCAMLRMFLNTCIRISVMPLGINKGKLCLHTDLNTYEQMRKYFGF